MAYLNLEHNLISFFKEQKLPSKIIICVSSGMDSMALMYCLNAIKKQLKLDLKALYIHHGKSGCESQKKYRNLAADLVESSCNKLGIQYLSNLNVPESDVLKSEEDFRNFRQQQYDKYSESFPDFVFALGHHQQDLLENRLIQLIRGSSINGFLSMKATHENKIRPFIEMNKKEIANYIAEKKIEYIDDPSNKQNTYLRNWLRNDLLPQVEEFRAGSIKTFSRSLQNIADELTLSNDDWLSTWAKVYNADGHSFQLTGLWLLNKYEQRKCIAKLLQLNGVGQYGRNQLDEVLKRLDSPEKVHKFDMLELVWAIRDDELLITRK